MNTITRVYPEIGRRHFVFSVLPDYYRGQGFYVTLGFFKHHHRTGDRFCQLTEGAIPLKGCCYEGFTWSGHFHPTWWFFNIETNL